MKSFLYIAVTTTLLLTPQALLADSWQIDPAHTAVEFKVRHLMVSWVKGVFTDVVGTAEIDDANLAAAQVAVTIDTTSIDTNNQKRDAHLRSGDFLDVANYPQMTFVSRRVESADGVPTRIVGDLTIRGTRREVVLNVDDFSQTVTDPWGDIRRGATATTTIKRSDFGLTWNEALETGGVVVGDEVHISLEVEMIRE
jgi:polyisoprenoid-binding protein YceI